MLPCMSNSILFVKLVQNILLCNHSIHWPDSWRMFI